MNKKFFFSFAAILVSLSAHASLNWSFPPVTLSNPGVDASAQQIVMDPNGNAIAVWIENNIVQSSTQPFQGSWTPFISLSNTGASAPQIAVDENGNATAVWVENGVITSSSLPLGGSWSPSVSLSSAGASDPDLAVDSPGNAVAIWTRNEMIESSTQLAGQSWPASPTVLSTSTASTPQIAIGGGNVVATWQGPMSGTNIIFAATTLAQGTWSAAQEISNTAHHSSQSSLVVDPYGNATATWYRYDLSGSDYSNVTQQAATLPFNGSWTTPIDIGSPGVMDPSQLWNSLAVDSLGNVMGLIAQSFDGSLLNSGWIIQLLGTPWTTPQFFVAPNPYAYHSTLAFLTSGMVVASWMFLDSSGSNLLIQVTDIDILGQGGRWSSPFTISANGQNAYPTMAASSRGNALNATALWSSWNGTNTIIQAATGTGQLLQPPQNPAVNSGMEDFHVFTELVNVLSWQPSPSPGVLGYNVYRDGVLISTIQNPNILQFIDYNRTEGVSATYSINSFDQYGTTSPSISVTISGVKNEQLQRN